MEHAGYEKLAAPEDRREFRRWVHRVAVVYGALVVAGLTFAIAHHHPAGSAAAVTDPGASVVAGYHARH